MHIYDVLRGEGGEEGCFYGAEGRGVRVEGRHEVDDVAEGPRVDVEGEATGGGRGSRGEGVAVAQTAEEGLARG